MRPLPAPADSRGAARADAEANTPLAPLSCFITTEAALDATAAAADSPRPEPWALSHAYKPSRSSSLSLSDGSARQRLPASPSLSSDMDHALPPTATHMPSGAFGLRPVTSPPSSPGNSSAISFSEDAHSVSASFAGRAPSPSPRRGPVLGIAASPVPQLVMPSLTIPRRRPFSEVGKSLGKLKLLVAGQAGIGKTSLLLSLAQCCNHIVYMDSVSPSTTDKVTEVHASTRPHPWWRADLDPVSYTKRRRRSSTTDDILDRNLCFADSPAPREHAAEHEIRYVESQLMRLCDKPIGDADLCTLLSGGAESIVDAVLYMLPHTGPGPADIKRIRDLQGMTNIIPLLARADELSGEEIALSKDRLVKLLGDEGVEWFSFAGPASAQEVPSIYAVSSATRPDRDNLDASLLMSSEYLQPLVSTDLEELVDRIFSLDGSSWLRHSAAVKSVDWRRRQLRHGTPQSALTCRRLTFDGALVPYPTSTPYVERRYWGRIELFSWADGLRQSLAAERFDRSPPILEVDMPRFEMPLARSGHAHHRQAQRQRVVEPVNANHQDPLGLLELASRIKASGSLNLELLSSVGALGCLAAWLIRPELAHHWGVSFAPPWCLTAC